MQGYAPTLRPHVFSEEAPTPPSHLDVAVLDNTYNSVLSPRAVKSELTQP